MSEFGSSRVDAVDRLRDRASGVLDDVSTFRWRYGGLAALAVIGVVIYLATRSGPYVPTPEDMAATTPTTPIATTATTAVVDLVVNAAGAVQSPGLYKLAPGARVADVIDAAGGATNDADTDRINLAEKVTDGERVYVVRKGQAPPDPAPASGDVTPAVVNLNTATLEQLDSLPGVGPATAQAILDYRTQHGSFKAVGDLAGVKGIGPAKLSQLQSHVSVS